MKITSLLTLPAFAFVLALGGCEKNSAGPSDNVLFQAVQDNVHAMEKKDLDAVMATIHPKSPSFESTRGYVDMFFKAVDVKYTLSDLKVMTSSPEEAKVSFVQKMEKTGGEGQFQNNIVEGFHTLRPDDGKWKIFGTVNLKVTGLDGKPLGAPAPAAEAAPAPAPAPAPNPNPEPAPKPAPPAEKPPQ